MMSFEKTNNILGIVVYEMKNDGCLNGIWTDNSVKGQLWNEIAKKKKGKKILFEGIYKSAYIDVGNKIVEGTLYIKKNRRNIFSIQWQSSLSKKIEYMGSGFRFGQLLIATYWKTSKQNIK